MKRVFLKDKNGNLVYPKPKYFPGINIEISQLPLYIYIPIKEVKIKVDVKINDAL